MLVLSLNTISNAENLDDFFSAKGIETSYDAGNLNDSKIFALDKATLYAFKDVAMKVIPFSQKNKIYKVRNFEIINAIKKIIPHDERMTHHSYMAKVYVYFDKQKITNILNKYGIRYRMEYSENILVLPLFYEKNNKHSVILKKDWRHTWLNIEDTFGLLRLSIYNNNLSTSINNPLKALFKPYNEFYKLLKEYNSKDLIVIFAELNDSNLEFTLRFLSDEKDELKYFISRKNFKETKDAFFKRAVDEVLERIDSEWKGIKSFNQTILFTSKIKIRTETPKVWTVIQQEFKNMPQIKNYKITKTTLDYIEVEVEYTIPSISFKELLAEKGILVNKDKELWYLSLAKI